MTSLRHLQSGGFAFINGRYPPSTSQVAIGERIEAEDEIYNLSKHPEGSSRLCFWQRRKDGAWVCYSTTSIVGGPHHGKFMVQTWTWSDETRMRVTHEPRFYSTRTLARRKAEAFYHGRKR